MLLRRGHGKKWVFGVTAVAAVYAMLWFVTAVRGVPQVRGIATDATNVLASNARESEPVANARPGQSTGVAVHSYVPLLIHADYHWQNRFESGTGKTVYLWLFGRALRIHEMRYTIP